MYDHYITYGQKEGRMPYANAAGGAAVEGIADTKVTAVSASDAAAEGIVPIDQLANYKSLKKTMVILSLVQRPVPGLRGQPDYVLTCWGILMNM